MTRVRVLRRNSVMPAAHAFTCFSCSLDCLRIGPAQRRAEVNNVKLNDFMTCSCHESDP